MKRIVFLFFVFLCQYGFPQNIDANTVVKVGIYDNEPLIFIDPAGQGKGIFADVVEYIASREGWQIQYVAGTWPQCLSRLKNNRIDILCTIAFSRNRDRLFDFTKENLLTNWGQLYTVQDSGIAAITDVSGKKVAFLKNDIHYKAFHDLAEAFGLKCDFIETDGYNAVMDLVSRNKADAGIANRFFGMKYAAPYRVVKSGIIFNPIKIHFAAPKGKYKAFLSTIDRHIPLLKEDDTSVYYHSLGKWLGAVEGRQAFSPWAKWTIAIAACLLMVLFLGNLLLRNRVRAKTKELTTELKLRKSAENHFRESENIQRTLMKNVPVGIIVVDQASRIIESANEAAASMFGVPREKIIGQQSHTFISSELQDSCPVCDAGQEVDNLESEIICGDGSRRTVLKSAKQINMFKQEKILECFVDITNLKQTQRELFESEERFRHLVQGAFEGIVIHENGFILEANDQYYEMFGYERYDLEGRNAIALTATPDAAKMIRNHIDAGSLDPYSVMGKKKDGSLFPIEIRARRTVFRGKDARMIAIRDLTAQKKNESALRESEEYHRGLFEYSPTPMFIQDFSRVEERITTLAERDVTDLKTHLLSNPEEVELMANLVTVSKINRAALDLYKAKSTRDLTKMLKKVVVRGDHQHVIDQIVAFSQGDNWFEGSGRNYNLDGEIMEIIVKKAVINRENNGLSKIVATVIDVTALNQAYKDREKLEKQLLHSQKMEAIGTLAGGIAHDFNNLLMGVQGRTSLMLSDISSDHEHYDHLKGIETYIKDMADLTQQLLGFARGGKFETKPVDINSLVKAQNRMFGRTRKEISIHDKYAKDLWAVEADAGQIKQVLMNLYINAWQAMPDGGDIYVQTQNTVIDDEYAQPFEIRNGRYVKVSVADTGIGMSEAVKNKIFDPFFTTKEKTRGTGLGLASAYGIIKNHNGFINVYSKKGEGATFNIYLPASDKKAIEKYTVAGKIVKGKGTILLVDDEALILDIGEQMLVKLGFEVMVAKGGTEAISLYSDFRDTIDLVILDMLMPGMCGGDVYDRLKEITPNIKVLLSSGYSINGQAHRIIDKGCNGFIQKPFNMREISLKISGILGINPTEN